MATVAELTAAYSSLLLRPEPGAGVCELCWNLTDGYCRCYACAHTEQRLAAMAPISYSVAHEQLHHVLAGYKRWPAPIAATTQRELAAVLWRHLLAHEPCHAAAARADRFELVTTVPAGTTERDRHQPLRRVVGELVGPTRDRYRRLLRRSDHPLETRTFDPLRFTATEGLNGEAILLIDDTWTTGASAQSAAAALRAAGAGAVAAVVIGRHVSREWRHNDRQLRRLAQPYDWGRCVHCAPSAAGPDGPLAPGASGRLAPGARTPSPRHASAG